jgi:hypothetical protein
MSATTSAPMDSRTSATQAATTAILIPVAAMDQLDSWMHVLWVGSFVILLEQKNVAAICRQ